MQNQTWKIISNFLQPVLSSWGIQIPSLGSAGNPCVTVGTTGVFGTSTCGGGGSNFFTADGSGIYNNKGGSVQSPSFAASSTNATNTFAGPMTIRNSFPSASPYIFEVGDTLTTPAEPGSFSGTIVNEDADPTSCLTADNNVINADIYSYVARSDGTKVFSSSFQGPVQVSDDGSGQKYDIRWDWSAVSGAAGYYITVQDNDHGYNFDVGTTTGAVVTLLDKGCVYTANPPFSSYAGATFAVGSSTANVLTSLTFGTDGGTMSPTDYGGIFSILTHSSGFDIAGGHPAQTWFDRDSGLPLFSVAWDGTASNPQGQIMVVGSPDRSVRYNNVDGISVTDQSISATDNRTFIMRSKDACGPGNSPGDDCGGYALFENRYSPSAPDKDILSANFLNVDEFGNVGIGDLGAVSDESTGLNPPAKATVYGSPNGNYPAFSVIPGGSAAASTTSAFIVASTGNVGIGTTSPYSRLSVNGTVVGARFIATTSSPSIFTFASTTQTSATSLCLSTDCRTAWPSAGANYWSNSGATTTLITGSVAQVGNLWATTTGNNYVAGNLGIGVAASSSAPQLVVANRPGTGNIASFASSSGSVTDYIDAYGVLNINNTFNPSNGSIMNLSSTANSQFTFTRIGGDLFEFKAQDSKDRIVFHSTSGSNNDPLFFDSDDGGTTRMTIAGNGTGIGINTESPAAQMYIVGLGTGNSFQIMSSTSASQVVSTAAGLFGIGTSSPGSPLSVAGSSFLGGNVTATGTLRLAPLAVAAGSFIAVDPTGNVIATATPSGGSGLSGLSPGTVIVAGSATTAVSSSSPTVGYVTATSTTGNGTSTIANSLQVYGVSSSTPEFGFNNSTDNTYPRLMVGPDFSTSSPPSGNGGWGLGNTVLNANGRNVLVIGSHGSDLTAATPGINTFTSRGTTAAPSATQLGDMLYFMGGRGFGSTLYANGSKAVIDMIASQNWTDSAQGTAITFETTPNNSTTRAEGMRLDSTGNLGIGTTTPITKLAVAGTITANNVNATSTGSNSAFSGTMTVGNSSASTPLTVTGNDTSGNGIVSITNNGSGTFINTMDLLAPNMSSGNSLSFNVGQSNSAGNSAGFNFRYQGNNSASNAVGFTFNSGSEILTLQKNGNLGVGTTTPATTLDMNGDLTIEGQRNCNGLSTNQNGRVSCSSSLATSTGSYRNLTATNASVNTYTPAASSTFEVDVSSTVDAISAGTLTITCTYTNTNNVSSTATFFPMGLTSAGLTTTGSPAFSPLVITPKKSTAVTVVATFTGVSVQYDIDASILPVGSSVN